MDYCLCGCGAQGGCFVAVFTIEDDDPDLAPEGFDDDAFLAQWDDDPSPYDGNYSEE